MFVIYNPNLKYSTKFHSHKVRNSLCPCQVVTEYWSGDELFEEVSGTQGLTKQVDPINLAQGGRFVLEDTPVVFCFQHFISLFVRIIPVCGI